jgi:general secretion pathway protein L
MSVLVIQVPPRQRLTARPAGGEAASTPRVAAEFGFVLSADDTSVSGTGRAAPALLPKADRVLVVLADADAGWHRVLVPKAPAARLRAALAGLMEEALLDDEDAVHFALAPDAVPGQPGWVAVMHRPWLTATLAELARHGLQIDAVLPGIAPAAPGAPASGHFSVDADGTGGLDDAGDDSLPTLVLSSADGVACLRLGGGLARALLPSAEPTSAVTWTASPAAASAAERWLGGPVRVCGDSERALRASQSAWNLLQFELAPRHRGTLALRDAARRFFSREWRPVRWGLAACLALQVVGINVWAWQQRAAVDQRRLAMVQLLQGSHPQVRAVLDAPLQMARETERLRAAAGRPGDGDLEVLLAAAALAWPDGQGPVQTLRFEAGRLTLSAADWDDNRLAQFRERLRPTGFAAELVEGRVTLTRAAAPAQGKA